MRFVDGAGSAGNDMTVQAFAGALTMLVANGTRKRFAKTAMPARARHGLGGGAEKSLAP